MAQSKHSPGPWLPAMMHARVVNIVPHRIHGFVGQIVTAGAMIAHVFGKSEAETEANARLIAAAPEMLVALQNAAGLLDTAVSRRRFAGDQFYGDVIASIRAAVAKAECV